MADPLSAPAPGEFTPASPMGYLQTFGPRADPGTALTWRLMDISIAVIVIVTALVLAGVIARRARTAEVAPGRGAPGGWLYIGLALTIVALGVSLVWTVQVLAQINSPAAKPALTLQVTAHQWWWEVRYLSGQPDQIFTTANEIHLPTGQPVLVELRSADVVHSFWVPALTGKTETIPGRVNLSWMQADRTGVYRGQCTEYCGAEHAMMALYVVAQPPAAFEAWRQGQVAAATAPATPLQAQGAQVFAAACGACHTVRGSEAGGAVGPDLTHLMSRRTIASGVLPNNPNTLAGWIANPQALKPQAQMPATNLTGPQLNAVVAYVETLK